MHVVIDQYVLLTVIGAVIVVMGVVLYFTRRRGGAVLLTFGALWLFTMVLYYALTVTGLYGSGSIVLNVIGLLILVVGGALSLLYLRKYLAGKGTGR